MPSRKTYELLNTEFELSNPELTMKKRGRKTFRSISNEHVQQALTYYLRTLKMIDADEEVISYFKTPEGIDVKIGVFNV